MKKETKKPIKKTTPAKKVVSAKKPGPVKKPTPAPAPVKKKPVPPKKTTPVKKTVLKKTETTALKNETREMQAAISEENLTPQQLEALEFSKPEMEFV